MNRARLTVVAVCLSVAALAQPSDLRAQAAAPLAPPPPAQAPASQAPLRLDQELPFDAAVRTGTLPNGLRYFIKRNGRPASRVSLRLAVDAGSMQEEDDQRGLAHFVEHMAFNGSTNFKPGELVAFLESIGARFGPHVNAQTSFDETTYMLDVPVDRPGYVDRGLLALHDFAGGVLLLPEEVERERGVVIEEWRGRLGAQSRIMEKQFPVLLGGSRYAERLPIGTVETLRTFKPERLRAFYERWYRPDRMAIVVVGDIEPEAAEALVRKTFADLARPSAPVPAIDRAVPPHDETRYGVVTDPEAQGWTVAVAYKHPVQEERTVQDYRRTLVRGLVLQMFNLRLEEIARRPDAPFLGAEAGSSPLGRSVQLVEIGAGVPAGGTAAGLEAIVSEARRMDQFGFSQGELDRARQSLLAGYEQAYKERDTSESSRLAAELVRHFLQKEPVPGIAFEYQLAAQFLPGVTVEETATVARTLIKEDSRVVLAVAPEQKATPVPTEATLRTAFGAASGRTLEAWKDDVGTRPLIATPPAPGKVTATRTIPELGVTVLTLSNGVEVWLKPTDFKADQVIISAYAKGGASLAAPGDYVEAMLSPSLVSMGGLGGFSPVDLSKLLSGKIASAAPEIGAYTHGIEGSASPRDLETALQLTYLAFTAPGMGDEAMALLKRRFVGMLENQAQNPRYVFGEQVELVNTSNHYTAKALTAADVQGLDVNAMRAFYTARFANAADFTFFVVGTFSVDTITPMLTQWIGSLPSAGQRTSAFKDMGVRFPDAVKTATVTKGREPASQTVMAFFADTQLQELEMHRARAAANVLSMRLRDILREKLGGTYGVNVGYNDASPLKGYGMMAVSFGSAPENVDTLQKAVLDEVARLQKEGPSAEDVAKVQEMERRDLETAMRQNSYWAGSLQNLHLLGWDATGILRRKDRIETLSVPVLHEMFRKYFPQTRYTVVTLKPEATGALR